MHALTNVDRVRDDVRLNVFTADGVSISAVNCVHRVKRNARGGVHISLAPKCAMSRVIVHHATNRAQKSKHAVTHAWESVGRSAQACARNVAETKKFGMIP
eukprot:67467_1